MKHCDKCHVSVRSNKEYCPLCHQHLQGESTELEHEVYPEFLPSRREVLPLTKKILRTATFLAVILLVSLNWILYNGALWAIIPIGGILYFWLLVRYGVLTNQNVPFRIAFLTTILVAILVAYDIRYGNYANQDAIYQSSWALNYVLPLAMLAAAMAISFIIWLRRMNYREYLFYLMTIVVFSFVPLALFLLRIIRFAWRSVLAFSVALFILLVIVFFFPKYIKDEIRKRFHV